MNKARFIAPLLLIASCSTFAQQVQQAAPQYQPVQPAQQQYVQQTPAAAQANYVQSTMPPQPNSGLGKEVVQKKPVAIVMPRPTEVVEDAIDDIEEAQLTEKQIERLKRLSLRRDRMKATPYIDPAKPITRTHIVNLDPGVPPPILRVTKGQLSSVVFSDMNGQPWMIKDVGLNREMFSDGREGAGAAGAQVELTNVLTLEPKMTAAYGNVTVRLKGLSTPVIFILAAAQQEVDMRVDSKVPGRNPDAPDAVTYTNVPAIDASLTSFLDGVPPKEARRLHVSGLANTEAWMHQDNLYVRTDAEAQYPAYYSSARSTSGKAVYRFDARQNSVTLLSNGRAVTVFIED